MIMSFNSHFKNIILRALLDSPAWVSLFDAVLSLIDSGRSFLGTFRLFLGFKGGVAVTNLPSPADESGFNPIWVDPRPVMDLLSSQGFDADFKGSLEMLPTGVGRLNCSSPYMCFKVFNALGVPRSVLQVLRHDLLPVDNSRRVDDFLHITGVFEGGLYSYKSLSPLRDGDLVYIPGMLEPVSILSYSKDFITLDQTIPVGYYSIYRSDALFPDWSLYDILVWTYPGVFTQLVFDRYSPAYLHGTAFSDYSIDALSLKIVLEDSDLYKKFWLFHKDLADILLSTNGLTEVDLDSKAIPESLFNFTMKDWARVSFRYGSVLNLICLTNWADFLTGLDSVYAYQFNISDVDYLFSDSSYSLLYSDTESRLYTDPGAPLGVPAASREMKFMDISVFLFFDPTQDFSFGFDYSSKTVFTWRATSKKASYGGRTVSVSITNASADLTFTIEGSVSKVFLNGIWVGSFSGVPGDYIFSGFTQDTPVYIVRVGRSGVWAGSEGVFIDGVLSDIQSYVKSTTALVRVTATPYEKAGVLEGSFLDFYFTRYRVPLVLLDKVSFAWDGLSFDWGFDLVQPVYFTKKSLSFYDSMDSSDSLIKQTTHMSSNLDDNEGLRVSGSLKLKFYDGKGKLFREDIDHNLIVSSGVAFFARLLTGATAGESISRIAVGTNHAFPQPMDSVITNSETFLLSSREALPGIGNAVFKTTIDYSQAIGINMAEFGLLTSTNTLVARRIIDPIVKTSVMRVEVEWIINFFVSIDGVGSVSYDFNQDFL